MAAADVLRTWVDDSGYSSAAVVHEDARHAGVLSMATRDAAALHDDGDCDGDDDVDDDVGGDDVDALTSSVRHFFHSQRIL